MTGNKITKRKIQKCRAKEKKKKKRKTPRLPHSYGCPTNPFDPFFLRI
jgi:hypothetical protein